MQKITSKTDLGIFLKLAALSVGIILAIVIPLLLARDNRIFATGENSPAECDNPEDSVDGNSNLLTVSAPEGEIVEGVCIKSGSNMFGEVGHSGVLGNGTYEDGCYTVSGVGTNTATVERNSSGPECQELSHIDGIFSPTPSPSPSSSPSPSPSASPSSSPSAAPSASPTPTPTPESSPSPSPTTTTSSTTTSSAGGSADSGAVAGASAENNPALEPAVLGASAELPETGIETTWFILGLFTLLSGTGLTILGLKKS